MENYLFEWPDAALQKLKSREFELEQPSHALLAIRSGRISHQLIESHLLAKSDDSSSYTQDKLIVLCFLYISRFDFASFASVLDQLRALAVDRVEVRALTIGFWLWQNNVSAISSAPSGMWSGLQILCYCAYVGAAICL